MSDIYSVEVDSSLTSFPMVLNKTTFGCGENESVCSTTEALTSVSEHISEGE